VYKSKRSPDLFCRSAALVLVGDEIPRTLEGRSALRSLEQAQEFLNREARLLNNGAQCSGLEIPVVVKG